MPVYEYECENCKREYAFAQSITELPKEKCPLCETPSLKRLISQSSFVLKGGGWTPKFGGR